MAQRNRKKDKSIFTPAFWHMKSDFRWNKLNYLSSRNLRHCNFAVKKNIDFIDLSDFEWRDSYL